MILTALVFLAGVLVYVYTRPPTRSNTALRRRLDDLEADHSTDHAELKRLVKRYRALEGHVYGSMEPEDDVVYTAGAPSGPNPDSGTGHTPFALLPDSDFPEDEFQRLVASKRGLPHG